jgi:hypothetical protein
MIFTVSHNHGEREEESDASRSRSRSGALALVTNLNSDDSISVFFSKPDEPTTAAPLCLNTCMALELVVIIYQPSSWSRIAVHTPQGSLPRIKLDKASLELAETLAMDVQC